MFVAGKHGMQIDAGRTSPATEHHTLLDPVPLHLHGDSRNETKRDPAW
jgi:hypothetical protein